MNQKSFKLHEDPADAEAQGLIGAIANREEGKKKDDRESD